MLPRLQHLFSGKREFPRSAQPSSINSTLTIFLPFYRKGWKDQQEVEPFSGWCCGGSVRHWHFGDGDGDGDGVALVRLVDRACVCSCILAPFSSTPSSLESFQRASSRDVFDCIHANFGSCPSPNCSSRALRSYVSLNFSSLPQHHLAVYCTTSTYPLSTFSAACTWLAAPSPALSLDELPSSYTADGRLCRFQRLDPVSHCTRWFPFTRPRSQLGSYTSSLARSSTASY